MSTMLTWLVDACRETGYPVIEVPGWQSRGHGAMTAAHGVVGHWTAGPAQSATSSNTPSLRVVRDGRPGLAGPLCNVYTAFDGTLYVVAAGKAYHAGVSDWRGETDLNNTFAGNEVESPGGFDYTPAQLDVTPRLHAALLRRMGRGAEWATAHYEVADPPGRKPDGPARDMPAFRGIVGRYLASPGTIRKDNKQEDDLMTTPISKANLAAIAGAVNVELRETLTSDITPRTVGGALTAIIARLNAQSTAADALAALVAAVRADTALQGDDEKNVLAKIEEVKQLVAVVPPVQGA